MKKECGEGNSLKSYWEEGITKRVKVEADAIMAGAGFYANFGIKDIIKPGTPNQVALFCLHFARYLVLKEGYELNNLLNSPNVEILSKLPIVGRLIPSLDRKNMAANQASEHLEYIARQVTAGMETETKLLAKQGGLSQECVMPPQIQNMANFLSTAFLKHRKSGSRKLRQAIGEVKDRFRTA